MERKKEEVELKIKISWLSNNRQASLLLLLCTMTSLYGVVWIENSNDEYLLLTARDSKVANLFFMSIRICYYTYVNWTEIFEYTKKGCIHEAAAAEVVYALFNLIKTRISFIESY